MYATKKNFENSGRHCFALGRLVSYACQRRKLGPQGHLGK